MCQWVTYEELLPYLPDMTHCYTVIQTEDNLNGRRPQWKTLSTLYLHNLQDLVLIFPKAPICYSRGHLMAIWLYSHNAKGLARR